MGEAKSDNTPVEKSVHTSDSESRTTANPMKSVTAPQMPTNRKTFALEDDTSKSKRNG